MLQDDGSAMKQDAEVLLMLRERALEDVGRMLQRRADVLLRPPQSTMQNIVKSLTPQNLKWPPATVMRCAGGVIRGAEQQITITTSQAHRESQYAR